jgi:hypothetical protein
VQILYYIPTHTCTLTTARVMDSGNGGEGETKQDRVVKNPLQAHVESGKKGGYKALHKSHCPTNFTYKHKPKHNVLGEVIPVISATWTPAQVKS